MYIKACMIGKKKIFCFSFKHVVGGGGYVFFYKNAKSHVLDTLKTLRQSIQ